MTQAGFRGGATASVFRRPFQSSLLQLDIEVPSTL
jgi:hypothetical protein